MLKVYNDLLIVDVRFPPFREKSVDVTYFTETIEHLEKKDGLIALKNLEKISRKAILITTPKEFDIGAIEDVIKERNIFQIHRSKWSPTEFKRRGYLVWGRYPWFLKGGLTIFLFFPPFNLFNLVQLPLEKSQNIVALKKFNNDVEKI